MGAWAGWEFVGRGREAGRDLRVEWCGGCGGSVYVMGYEIGDGGWGNVVDVGEGGEEEDGCWLVRRGV